MPQPETLRHRALAPLRRRVVRVDTLNRHLPWPLWCAVGAADALAVSWVIALRAGRPLRFVQIGANDGVTFDPLHAVVRACGWTGVLVEPVPAIFERLVQNYHGVSGVSFENSAIGTLDGDATLYSVDARPGDPWWVGLVASFDRDLLCSHHDIPSVEQRIVEIPVPTLTLSTLIAKHDLTSIDLLNIDTEGYDYEILKQIDFSAPWAPSFIIYESRHFDRATARAALDMLRSAGYRLADIWPDMLAYRRAPESIG